MCAGSKARAASTLGIVCSLTSWIKETGMEGEFGGKYYLMK